MASSSHSEPAIFVLLVEDNAPDALLIQTLLDEAKHARFTVEHVVRLSAAMTSLATRPADAVLLDLSLVDSAGITTFRRLHDRFPTLPILVLTGLGDDTVGMQAIQEGAQDFLSKGSLEGQGLERALRYAIERKRTEVQLQEQTRILQSILASVSDGIVVVNEAGCCTAHNPASERLMGFRPDPQVPEERWPKTYGGIFRSDGKTEFAGHEMPLVQTRGGEVVKDLDVVFRHSATQEGVAVSINAAPLRDDKGAVLGGVAVLRDITEQRQSLERIRLLNAELKQRISERTQEFETFGFKIARDLKPYLKHLEDSVLRLRSTAGRKLGDESVDAIKSMLVATTAMNRLIDALVELSRTPRTDLRKKLGLLDRPA